MPDDPYSGGVLPAVFAECVGDLHYLRKSDPYPGPGPAAVQHRRANGVAGGSTLESDRRSRRRMGRACERRPTTLKPARRNVETYPVPVALGERSASSG